MNNPRMYAQEDAIDEQMGMTDEAMLDTVQQAMGNDPRGAAAGGPPPGSGMKWVNLEEDQAALMQNPAPENVEAFVQYWGEENLPPELAGQTGGGMPTGDAGGGMY